MLNNRKAVVAEVGPDTEIDPDIRAAIMAVPYENLVDACVILVGDEVRRHMLESNGFSIFSERLQKKYLEDAISDLMLKKKDNVLAPTTEISSSIYESNSMPHPDISISELILRRSTPVIINSFNQFTYLKNIVSNFIKEGFRNIYILDQASTYPPLLEWLAGAHERGEALPLYSPTNKGPHDFFISKKYNLFGGAPFIYSDPDLSWYQLAPDFLTRLFELAHRHHVFKVGPALIIPDASEIKPDLTCILDNGTPIGVADFESRFWAMEVEPGVYNSPIDTTMHLFIPQYYQDGAALITGLRVAGEGYSVVHLPWFNNDPMPNEEYRYYLNLTMHTTWRPDGKQFTQVKPIPSF